MRPMRRSVPFAGGSRAHRRLRSLAPVLCALMVAPPVWGVSPADKIEIHGFGGWAFADTDGNRYLLGDADGNYDTSEFSLNITAKPVENLTIVAQVHLERERGEEEVELDYAFGEWSFSDAARIRFGRVKHPYGIYAEIFDVGTVRPFYLLPQAIYGKQGFTGKNYNGVGLKGSLFSGRWGLEYDLYAGQIQSDIALPGALTFGMDLTVPSEIDDVLGARVNVETPIEGLRLGASGFFGTENFPTVQSATRDQDRENYGVHLEYQANPWLIRAEYSEYSTGTTDVEGSYLELAYRFGKHWQVAGRFDNFESSLGGPTTDFFDGLLSSEDVGVALSYWFSPSFVLRLNYHRVEGNRFAFPEDPAEILAVFLNDVIETETDMILVGAQFSF